MRLDKYLKISRLIKRRTIAKQACDTGRILVNAKEAKASTDIGVGDVITINLGANPVSVKVTSTKEHVSKDEARELYEIEL